MKNSDCTFALRHRAQRPRSAPIYDPDYYAAFVIDPDGYRIEAYFGPGEV
jgi:hypothetical protein